MSKLFMLRQHGCARTRQHHQTTRTAAGNDFNSLIMRRSRRLFEFGGVLLPLHLSSLSLRRRRFTINVCKGRTESCLFLFDIHIPAAAAATRFCDLARR
jgi:hypothetical protein